MFTGIITAVGSITQVLRLGAQEQFGARVHIQTPLGYLDDVALGDSIAIQGACMTVTQLLADGVTFTVDVSAESLARTNGYAPGEQVNLEKALRAHDRLGGHIVTGHVDAVATVARFAPVGESHELVLTLPPHLARFFAYKGSITVNGVSLTVNSVHDHAQGCDVGINLIPHTVQNTALRHLRAGSPVNVEVDVIARYCERILAERAVQQSA